MGEHENADAGTGDTDKYTDKIGIYSLTTEETEGEVFWRELTIQTDAPSVMELRVIRSDVECLFFQQSVQLLIHNICRLTDRQDRYEAWHAEQTQREQNGSPLIQFYSTANERCLEGVMGNDGWCTDMER